MLSRAQQILLKRAQAQACISDADYRQAIEDCTGIDGCRSSQDPRLTDTHLDHLMGYFESIFWGLADAPQRACNPTAPFRQPGFWADKNRRGNTSRDRFVASQLSDHIAALESELAGLGYGAGYCAAIRRRMPSASDAQYAAALRRTLASKRAS